MIQRSLLLLAPAYFVMCLLLGGASGGGYWANLFLQLIAIPIILWALVVHRNTPLAPSARQLLALVAAAGALVLCQLIPLPPSVWTSFPGRENIVRGFELLGQPLPWMPISLSPYQTIASAVWALPAVAVLLAMLRIGAFRSKWLVYGLLAVTAAAIAIGVLQLGQGRTSPLYFYRISNTNSATGFFANTNNMGEMMVVCIPFLAALFLSTTRKGASLQKRSSVLVVILGALAVLAVGIALNGSLAGIGLTLPAVAASGLMLFSRGRKLPAFMGLGVVALLALSALVVLSTPFGNNLTTEDARASQLSRYTAFTVTAQAIGDYLPAGSGVGTFPLIYPSYEDAEQVTRWYMNHAHNDYLELILETGVAGLILMGLFLAWWVMRLIRIWRTEDPDPFARAATIASAVILAHSAVEFPLRTAAIGAIFAMCCALMAEARPRAGRKSGLELAGPRARHLSAD